MRHVPHVLVPAPWDGGECAVPSDVQRHLGTVLRLGLGAEITYTDGQGTVGEGRWNGATMTRGTERARDRIGPPVTLAVAPPRAKERQRFIVEKLQELGVQRLVWLATSHTQGRPPTHAKARAWAVSGLEQSRGAHLMAIGTAAVGDLDAAATLLADVSGVPVRTVALAGDEVTVAIGPEGGWTSDESARFAHPVSLGPTILRTETAAIVAAAAFR